MLPIKTHYIKVCTHPSPRPLHTQKSNSPSYSSQTAAMSAVFGVMSNWPVQLEGGLAQWHLRWKAFRMVSSSSEKKSSQVTSPCLQPPHYCSTQFQSDCIRAQEIVLHQTEWCVWTVNNVTFDFTGSVIASWISGMKTTLIKIHSTSETRWENSPECVCID